MKGMVFTEFPDFVSGTLGADTVDRPNGEAYTAVGTAPRIETQGLMAALYHRIGMSAPEVLGQFGRAPCDPFVGTDPALFATRTKLFDFFGSANGLIPGEIHKLDPEAERAVLRMSRRRLDARADGINRATAAPDRQPVALTAPRIQESEEATGSFVRSSLRHAA